MKNIFPLSTLGLCAALLSGCASINDPSHGIGVTEMRADERGFVAGLGIESQDMVTIAEKMARGMLS